MIGIIGWAVILGIIVVWEGLALVTPNDAWPTLSDLMRTITRSVAGRWILFAVWLWIGWHLFVRGWDLFLRDAPSDGATAPSDRGRGASAPAVAIPESLAHLQAQEVVALGIFYAAMLVLLYLCARELRRHGARGASVASAHGARTAGPHLAATAAAGYALFLGVVGLYAALAVENKAELLRDAALGGGFLAFVVAVPALLVPAAVARVVRRRGRDAG